MTRRDHTPTGAATRFRRAPDVPHDELDGFAVLLDPGAMSMLTLNPVGTLVWQLLDQDRTCAEIAALVLPKVRNVTAEQLEVDVASFLDELVRSGVVVTREGPP